MTDADLDRLEQQAKATLFADWLAPVLLLIARVRELEADKERFEFWFSMSEMATAGTLDEWRQTIDEFKRARAQRREEPSDG